MRATRLHILGPECERTMKLNLGCGPNVVDGWINVDYALGAKLTKLPLFSAINRRLGVVEASWDNRVFLHDLTRRFPWPDASTSCCYSSHTLEHLTREQGVFLLKESHRVLRSGGVVRIVVPDLGSVIRKYGDGTIRADRFLETLDVLYGTNKRGFKKLLAPFYEYPHKCMYDTSTLISVMRGIGFVAESRHPFDSRITGVEQIEVPDRTVDAVIVEGVKQ
jgi:SAM-dependent methyltransferase